MTLTMKAGRGLPVKFTYATESMTAQWTILSTDDEDAIISKLESVLGFVRAQLPAAEPSWDPPTSAPMEPPAVPNGWELISSQEESAS